MSGRETMEGRGARSSVALSRRNRSGALSSRPQVLEGGVEVSEAVANPLILNGLDLAPRLEPADG